MAVGDAHVFTGFLTPVLTQFSFQSHRLLFSHASGQVRGENTPERNFASTGSQTHNHQVMRPTSSPLCQRGGGIIFILLDSLHFTNLESYLLCYLLSDLLLSFQYFSLNIQNRKRNVATSIILKDMKTKYSFLFFTLQVFIATQSVGTHHKKLNNNKLPLHQSFIITHIDNFIV